MRSRAEMRATILRGKPATVTLKGGQFLVGRLRGVRFVDTGRSIRTLHRVDCDFELAFGRDDGEQATSTLEFDAKHLVAADRQDQPDAPLHSDLTALRKLLERPRAFGKPPTKKQLAQVNKLAADPTPAVLLELIRIGATSVVLGLIETGTQASDPDRGSLLLEAITQRRTPVAVALACGRGGYALTPAVAHAALVEAIDLDCFALTEALCRAGADPNGMAGGRKALDMAAKRRADNCVRALLDAGAVVDGRRLAALAEEADPDTHALVLERPIPVEVLCDGLRRTTRFVVEQKRNWVPRAQELIAAGADPDQPDTNGESARSIATAAGHPEWFDD